MSEKKRRHDAILTLIQANTVSSQDALCELLEQLGFSTTQTTLSRDLTELGIWKGPEGYSLPAVATQKASDKAELVRVLAELLVSAQVAGNLLVLKTLPGRAQVIGYELDNTSLEKVVGNISGDDTVFIATSSEADAVQLKTQLQQMIASTRR